MSQIKLGNTDIPFVFRGDELMYPNYVKDGLVLHYDFSGMTNADTSRGVAKDLSGNGNHDTLQNFNFTAESGYDENKLLFDGVDDYIDIGAKLIPDIVDSTTMEFVFYVNPYVNDQFPRIFSTSTGGLGRGGMSFYFDKRDTHFGLTYMVDNDSAGNVVRGNLEYNKTYHIVHVYTEDFDSLLYINGVLLDSRKYSTKTPDSPNAVLGWDEGFSGNRYNNDYNYSAKIYNRPLTPEEIAHNYAIEKERFGIE